MFDIKNPEGSLRSGETSHLVTTFRPLEATQYSLDLPIKVSDMDGATNDPYVLRLRGTGYHFEKSRPKEVPFYEDLPLCRANLNDNGSMSAFSTESIDFGELG